MNQTESKTLRQKVVANLQNEKSRKERTVKALSQSGMFNPGFNHIKENLIQEYRETSKGGESEVDYKELWDLFRSAIGSIPLNGWGNNDKEFIMFLSKTMRAIEGNLTIK